MKMTFEFGFIGCGNMGGALSRAVSSAVSAKNILLANRTKSKAEALAEELGAAVGTNAKIAAECRYIFLCVKPQMMEKMLCDIKAVLAGRKDRFVLISVAAGLTTARIAEMAGGDYPMIRMMPNTPVSVGAGMIQFSANEKVTAEEKETVQRVLAGAARLDELEENKIDAASAVSGCGPAFADLFIEALADGGVEIGLPRDKALLYAAQMLKGSAELLLQSGKHPGELKDAVCSPGGSTICGVHALENGAFRSSVMNAVKAAYEKNLDLGKN